MKHLTNITWQEINWQRPYQLETIWNTLTHLAATTPRGAVVWETRGKNGHVRHLLGADPVYINEIKGVFSTHGDVQFREVASDVRQPVTLARTLKISHPMLSLNTDIASAAIRAGLAALAEDKSGREMAMQIVLGRGFAPSPVPAELSDPSASWLNVILGTVSKSTTEARKSVKEKAEQHSFQTVIRIGVSSEGSSSHLRSLLSALKVLESAGVRIRDEAEKPERLNCAHVPWHFPLQLSVKELTNFFLLPAGEEELPGTPGLHPRLTLPPKWYRNPTSFKANRTFALSMDLIPKKLSISPKDSLEHTHLIGPTGSGKSTAMQHLILADICANRSVLVLDPKADLVTDILSRIPEERAKDVVVIDPSAPNPCGFNPLAFGKCGNKALLADSILSVMKEIFSDSWGVRLAEILNAALLTLVEINGATLLWLPALLTDDAFRMRIIGQLKDRIALLPFWEQFNSLKESERRQQIDPVLNKIRQFLLRPGLRNVLGQAHPKFDLTDLFTQRKIVLVPLNKGQIGGESARLLGSFIVGLTWTLALGRASIPPERRHLVSIYIDELQDYLSLPTDLSDALAQARGLGVGMTLAHQYRDQLPPEIRAGIDANTRNKICFGLNSKDAKDMAAMAPELTAEDFMMLPRYQIYTSFQQDGKNTGWVLGKILPPIPTIRDPAELYARSMAAYGAPAEEVEAEYLKAVVNPFTANSNNNPGGSPGVSDTPNTPIGRRRKS